MATYFHGAPEIHADGLQTLYLMNPGYVGYSDTAGAPLANMALLNSGMSSLNPMAIGLTHSSPPTHHQSQHLLGIPIPPPPENSNHYNLCNQMAANHSVGRVPSLPQGLSLSLCSQQLAPYGYRHEAMLAAPLPEIAPASSADGFKIVGSLAAGAGASRLQSVLMNSKYLRATHELLDEVVSVGKGFGEQLSKKDGLKSPMKVEVREVDVKCEGDSHGKQGAELSTTERQELQMKKAKLLGMLDEVEQRYKQYHHQMQMVVSTFEAVAGHGSAKTYTALALQTISKQFRCLRDAITGQIKATGKILGEEECLAGGAKSIGTRLRLVDHHMRQQRALQQLGMMQQSAWRPQRGLPERAVSILRAWLFEHFLHPYPKDSDKLMLAKQTGLTRNQVSNWFINARVRLWKPMVEEMYTEEMKELGQSKPEEKSCNSEANEDSASKSSSQSKREQASTLTSKQDNQIDSMPSPIRFPAQKYGIAQTQDEAESMQTSLEKERGIEYLHLPLSMNMHMKSEISNRELLIKFMKASANGNNENTLMPSDGNHGGGFGAYTIGELGRFDTQHFAPSFHGNGVSLTLGLPYCESISLSGTEPAYLTAESIQMATETNTFCSLNDPQTSHPSNAYEGMEIPNRKRFAAQLLPDFVA
ncbi:hypothetical protein HPP92_025924 [Vanilla planifolia]|uniref:Homeobox domain-containing protein n=1 Tax=Vanilla planifolia TaxID=51239 RepID=A0A835UAA3_VANPL|nr:hypothetical protein HPP92_025924 [Vanilla planifolia]KAG0469464.1 hypothetical protein HPP92_016164 [Vanilla planifolia]